MDTSWRILTDWNRDGTLEELPARLQPAQQFAIALPLAHRPAPAPGLDATQSGPDRLHPAEAGRVVVQIDHPLPPGSTLRLRLDAEATGRVSLFRRQDRQWASLGAAGAWTVDLEPGTQPRLELGLAAHSFAHAGWSGDFALAVALEAGDGGKSAAREIPFRVAPFLLASALDPVEEVLVVENARTAGFVAALRPILQEIDLPLRTIQVPAGEAEEYDLWPQDALEIGRVCAPRRQGIHQSVAVLTGLRALHDTMNCEPLDRAARALFGAQGAILVDAASPRADTRWIDWYGNLEVSPPVTSRDGREFPWGRILTGQQDELTLHPDLMAFLEAQRLQVPPLVIDTSWLGIGHVDEVVSFIPARTRPGFRLLFPSISLARTVLEEAAAQGYARELAFAGHREQMTVEALLDEVVPGDENRQIEAILAGTRQQLCEGLGVEPAHFVELPALFREGLALIPNCINSLIVNGHAIVPDPEGPHVDGEDAFARAIRTALEAHGLRVHFLDVWDTYHWLGGEIHCGTNAVRRLSNPAWWRTAPPPPARPNTPLRAREAGFF
jgi:protein-arginine deiminase